MSVYRSCASLASLVLFALALLSGCINTEFGCKGYPDGAQCQAVSQVLALDPTETGGYLSRDGESASQAQRTGSAGGEQAVMGQAPMQLGQPIVRAPEVVRVWLAPWRDDQDRLHEASYIYLMLTPAEWAYRGPTLGKSRRDRNRAGVSALPLAPGDRSHGADAKASALPSAAVRPTPQAAGVLPASQSSSAASVQKSSSAPAATQGTGAGSVLMVPGPQGVRPVPLPQIPSSSGSSAAP